MRLILRQSKFIIPDLVTSTATAVLVLRDSAVLPANMFIFSLEIIRMAGSAEGCVLGRGPGNGAANGVTVAPSAPRIPSVVARIVTLGTMAKDGWCPAIGGMTHIALFSRR